jgi:hypothetical protein
MIPQPYSLLGRYAALIQRLEKISGGTAAAKKERSTTLAALKSKHDALLAAYHKLLDAQTEYEDSSATAISSVNRSLAALRRAPNPPLPANVEREVEQAMLAGAAHLDDFHKSHGTVGDPYILPTPTASSGIPRIF